MTARQTLHVYWHAGTVLRHTRHIQDYACVNLLPPPPQPDPEGAHANMHCALKTDTRVIDLRHQDGRVALARVIDTTPLYRLSLELALDKKLAAAKKDPQLAAQVKAAFAPEDPPEPVQDVMAEKYAFSGVLAFPALATRKSDVLLALYLKLQDTHDPTSHIMAVFGANFDRLKDHADALVLDASTALVRLDHILYDAHRTDHDPDATKEEMVARGRTAALSLSAGSAPATYITAWLAAEKFQASLCRDIDLTMTLNGLRQTPRWVRHDVFRLLEREAMKQVFAEAMIQAGIDLPRGIQDTIEDAAQGGVNPLIQNIVAQTLTAGTPYTGSAGAFVLQAERRAK